MYKQTTLNIYQTFYKTQYEHFENVIYESPVHQMPMVCLLKKTISCEYGREKMYKLLV